MNTPSQLPIFPGTVDETGRPATLGVMGGGQLGRMFVHAAQRLGYFTAVLDPDPQSPAGRVSHHHIPVAYGDAQGLAQLDTLVAVADGRPEGGHVAEMPQSLSCTRAMMGS